MNLGRSIRIALAKSGMRSSELADKLGMSRSSFSHLKTQESCTGSTLMKLASAFDMPVSEFVKLGEEM